MVVIKVEEEEEKEKVVMLRVKIRKEVIVIVILMIYQIGHLSQQLVMLPLRVGNIVFTIERIFRVLKVLHSFILTAQTVFTSGVVVVRC